METKNTYQIVEVALLVLALMFITSGCERSLTNSTASVTEGPDLNQSSKYLDAVREFADNRSAQYSFKDTVPDVILASQSPADFKFGHFVATGSDVNGDGYDDFATTANRFDDCRGRVYLYFGAKDRVYERADQIFDGEALGDFFGMWILLADLNNDKYADVIVGAVGHNNWQGRVYVFFGGPDMDEQADMIFDEESGTGSWFGRVIDAADIDRDGYTDLIINAVGIDKAKGRAYLYYGGDPMDTVADKIFDGENSGDVFGREMDMGSDVNGDGYGDIIFGSRSWNARTQAGSGQGRAYLYYGGPKETMDTTCDKVFTGENMLDQFGSSVCLFDIDADGYAEVLVGARGYSSYQGRMYLYWGKRDMDTTQPDLVFNGEKQSDFGGDNIDCGYLNDDKYGDILIGGYSGGQNRNGRVYLYYGAPKASIDTVFDHTFTGEGGQFSWQISIGKINGDKYDDFVVASDKRTYVYNTKPFPVASENMQPQLVTEISKDIKPMNSLHRAASEGDITEVNSLIAAGANINSLASDTAFRTPLHEAAISGHIEVVDILLNNGARVDALDNMGYTPLHRAVENGRIDVATLLIDKGADVNAETLEGLTPLHFAIRNNNIELVKLLLSADADVNIKDYRGQTPLALALQRSRPEILKLLKSKVEISSIHLAAQFGDLEKVKAFLEQGTDINAKDEDGDTALYIAVNCDYNDIAELLIDQGANVNAGDEDNYTPLYYAIWNSNKDMVSLLVSKGADVNVTPEEGDSILNEAVWMMDFDIVKILVDNGTKYDVKDEDGLTALYYAIYQGSMDMVELFISKGIDTSSIHMAACAGDLDRVKELVKQGTEVDANDEAGWTALFWAVVAGQTEVAEFLINNNADISVNYGRGQSLLHQAAQTNAVNLIELLITKGIDVNVKNQAEATPIFNAASAGNLQVIELLVSKGADVNAKNRTGRTPLHSACQRGNKEVAEFLIDKGADINAKNGGGMTPLHLAARSGRKDIVELLIAKGADRNVKNNDGNTPLSLAEENGHTEIVELLKKHGAEE